MLLKMALPLLRSAVIAPLVPARSRLPAPLAVSVTVPLAVVSTLP